jgi:small subunit ribosomal protein S18
MAESKGRPGSASQRPTGGDKAVATQKKQYFRRKKVCRFCVEKIDDINYKDVKMLHAFVAERGKIVPRRISCVRRISGGSRTRSRRRGISRCCRSRPRSKQEEIWKSFSEKTSKNWAPGGR